MLALFEIQFTLQGQQGIMLRIRNCVLILGLVFMFRESCYSDDATTRLTKERFSVALTGEGPDILIIPGLASSPKSFESLIAKLKSQHRCHAVQIHGFGNRVESKNSEGPLLQPIAQELGEYLRSLGKPAIIVGHSMGGELALMLAMEHADFVERIVVCDALPYFSLILAPNATTSSTQAMATGYRDSLRSVSDADFRVMQESTVQRLVKTKKYQPSILEESLASDRRVMANAMYDLMTTDLRADLQKIKVPVNVLYAFDEGMGIPSTTVKDLYEKNYSALSQVKFHLIENSYHFVMLDQPQIFEKTVLEILSSR